MARSKPSIITLMVTAAKAAAAAACLRSTGNQIRSHRCVPAALARWAGMVVLAWMPLFAQAAERWVVRQFGLEHGMPVSSATSAQMDADGFLWFATHDGLARFDGRRFTVFDSERFPSMGNNRVNRLFKGSRGTIYGHGALGAWLHVDSRQVRRLVLDPAHPEAKVSFVTRLQPENASEAALCVTLSTGLYCEASTLPASGFTLRRAFDPTIPVIAALPYAEHDWLVVRGQGIYLAHGRDHRLVWADENLTMTGALSHAKLGQNGALIVPLRGGVRRVMLDGSSDWVVADPQLDVVQLQISESGDIEISTSHESFRVDRQGQRSQIHPKQPLEAVLRRWPEPTRPSGHRQRTAVEWFSRGGVLFQDGRQVLQTMGSVEDVLFTDSGVVWVSTSRDGVYALSPLRLDLINHAELARSNVYGTAMARDGSVWLGTLGNGVFRIAANDHIDRFDEAHGLPGPNIWGIGVTPEQTILAFPLRGGAWQFQPEQQRFVRLILPAALNQARLRSMSADAQGRLWLAGSEGAWRRTVSESGSVHWEKQWPSPERAEWSRLAVQSILHDQDGRTWFATDQGLYWQLDGQSEQIESLRAVAIRGMLRAHDGALWVATEGKGLKRLAPDDLRGLAPLQVGRAQGAPSNSPHSLVEDAHQQLWVNSNQGVYRVTPSDVATLINNSARAISPLTLGLADGLLDLEGNGGVQPAAAVGSDGRIWFPTQKGIVRFSPDNLTATRFPGRVIIESLSAGRQTLVLDDAHAASSMLQLPLGDRDVSVSYNAAELNSGQVRFRHRLIGPNRQQQWLDVQTAESASFDALAPGTYRFEVQAGNADGHWRTDPATVAIEIPAYIHETRLFRWSSGALLLLLSGLAVRWRLRQLELRARQLETVVQQRTDELARAKANVEQALSELADSHAALSESHLGIASRNQRLAEQATRLEGLDRFRTRLLADVSHELRSPLMLVNLPLQSLSERHLPEADQRLVSLAKQNADRLSHLIEQLVHLVQAEAQQIQLRFRRIDLLALTQRIVDGFAPLSQKQNLSFVIRSLHESALPQIFADPEQLTTVIRNLLDNASKYAPNGSEVRIDLELVADSDHIRLSIQDNGPGFPPELADRLFERFFRADGPPRAGREGLGVGLALAQELIYLHGGSIRAANRSDASGACFWFDLPLGSAHLAIDDLALENNSPVATPLPETRPSARAIEHGRLLLVEDHPDLAAYLADQLSAHCTVVVAADAESAWAQIQEKAVDCIVSDVVLPGIDGIALCARMKADDRFSDVPMILISAKAGSADRASGIAAGAHAWLTKPFSIETLLKTVESSWPTFSSMRNLAQADNQTELSENTEPIESESRETLTSSDHRKRKESATPARVNRLLALAEQHLEDPEFGIAQWAEKAHLSERQLRRRVTELTGASPVAWLREKRLFKVHDLVSRAKCRTLAEAGLAAGIHNAAYLYRLYRARFGERGLSQPGH